MPGTDPRVQSAQADTPAQDAKGSSGGLQNFATPASGPGPVLEGANFEANTLPKVGDRLEFFEIHEPVGAGGMGAVYRASDLRLDRQVALKILPPEQASDAETVQRFYLEGRAAARLDHENIARVYTLGQDKDLHFIAYEYVEGTNLRQRVEQRGVLSSAEGIDIALQIAGALVHAAQRRVVHRDIKPSNIIVTPEGRAKLVDMGLARRFERERSDDGLTQSGMTLGTFDYISPEQARDPRNVDIRSDLYSLGCTLYHMLTGQPPFPEGTVLQKLLQHQEDPAPDMRSLNPNVPAALANVVLKLMEKDRERRFQSPEALRAALLDVADTVGLRLGDTEVASERAVRGWEQHVPMAVSTLAGLLILAGLYLWSQPFSEPPATTKHASAPRRTTNQSPPKVTAARTAESVTEPLAVPVQPADQPIQVGSNQDLSAVIARAPTGSTIELNESGPYRVRLTEVEPATALRSAPRNLTIKAGGSASPIIKVERGAARMGDLAALLWFRGGSLRIEGIEFDLANSGTDGPLTALALDGVDTVLTRCTFRAANRNTEAGRTVAITLRSGVDSKVVPPVRILDCALLGSQVGVHVLGATDLDLREVRSALTGTLLWVENRRDATIPLELRLDDARIIAGDEPVLRLDRARSRVVVERSVIGATRAGQGTLVSTNDPDALDWRGRENLYSRIGRYLVTTGVGRELAGVRSFSGWADSASATRELRSRATDERIWVQEDPSKAIADARGDLATLFTMAGSSIAERSNSDQLAPFGKLTDSISELMRSALARRTSSEGAHVAGMTRAANPLPSDSTSSPLASTSSGISASGVDTPRNDTASQAAASAPAIAATNLPMATVPTMPPMPENPSAPMIQAPLMPEDDSTLTGASTQPSNNANGSTVAAPSESQSNRGGISTESAPRVNESSPSVATGSAPVNSEEDWRRAVSRLGTQGGTIRVSSSAQLKLELTEIPRGGRWTIEGEAGASRARIQLISKPSARVTGIEFPPLFRVASGAFLELRDLDLVVESASKAGSSNSTVFLVEPGSDLSLSRCTVTIAPAASGAAPTGWSMLHVSRDRDVTGESPTASVRLEDCFVRMAGDVIDVAARRRLDCTLTNTVVAATSSLLRAQGVARGTKSETLKLTIRQSTVRAAGGLVRLVSSGSEPQLQQVDVIARDSILATTERGDALLRIESQEDVDDSRNRITWEGHGVVYHMIDVYRLHDSVQSGTTAVPFRRLSWDVAVGPREDTPFHGDARLARPWRDDQRAWTVGRDDMRLAFDSPVASAGPRLDRVPEPPRIGNE